ELDASDLLLMSRSEDLNYINSMEGEAYFRGELEPLSQPDRLLYFSKEHGNPYFAHLTLLGIKEFPGHTRCEAPLGTSFCGRTLNKAVHDSIHAQEEEVAVIATHPFPTFNLWDISAWPGSGVWRGMPLDLVSGAVDGIDLLCYTHAWPPEGIEAYVHALNAGFRVPPSAGTDAAMGRGNSRPPGGYRVYVAPPECVLTLDGWIAGLKAGRSFVTNYPLINVFELEGHTAGEVIEYDGGVLRGRVSALCVEPMDSLTIIGNGGVLHVFKPSVESRGLEIAAEFTIDPRGLTWVLARVEGDARSQAARWHNMDANGLFAQTAPIYIEQTTADDKYRHPRLQTTAPAFQRDAVNYFLDFLDQLQLIFDANGDFPDDSRVKFDRAMRAARQYYSLAAGDPPKAFDLIGPCKTWNKPYAVVQTSRPTFIWQRAPDPDPNEHAKYVFAIDTLPSFESATLIATLHDTSYTPSKKDSLLEGVTYYWRVRAYDPTGYEVASTTDCCTLMVTFDPTGIPGYTPPIDWGISGIHPNPFNRTVRIDYTTPGSGEHHDVSVYDVNGKLVRRLYRGNRSGAHRLHWNGQRVDGSIVASGVYFVRLSPRGSSSIVKKVVVLR
ncbi:MAG: T9SS type A sorting domain-containing protein, partial [Candidatus Latescibacterota bacterium]